MLWFGGFKNGFLGLVLELRNGDQVLCFGAWEEDDVAHPRAWKLRPSAALWVLSTRVPQSILGLPRRAQSCVWGA